VNRDSDFLLDIVEMIEAIRRHQPDDEPEFVGDEVLFTAVVHWIQTIGEAANGVSKELRERHPQVPWRQIVDMRNLLAHGYRHVDPSIVWQVVVRDLPPLDAEIRRILESLD
jgi:uncharacterized protein with HEPN domain